ncbi:hypothetical protein S83_054489 [Arachis hypogaea]|nr:Eukaryotic translation initiation factor 4E [Arachis hypogaea]
MVVEDTQKSSITDNQITTNPNNENKELEEGEILDDNSFATSRPPSSSGADTLARNLAHTLFRTLRTSGSITPPLSPSKQLGEAPSSPFIPLLPLKISGGQPSFFSHFSTFGHDQNRMAKGERRATEKRPEVGMARKEREV